MALKCPVNGVSCDNEVCQIRDCERQEDMWEWRSFLDGLFEDCGPDVRAAIEQVVRLKSELDVEVALEAAAKHHRMETEMLRYWLTDIALKVIETAQENAQE